MYNVTATIGRNETWQPDFCDQVSVSGMAVQYALVCRQPTFGKYIKISYDFYGFLYACDIEVYGSSGRLLHIPTLRTLHILVRITVVKW